MTTRRDPRRARPARRTWRRVGLGAATWAAVTLVAFLALFPLASTGVEVAGHDAEVSPTYDGWVTVRTGPLLPDVRLPSPTDLGPLSTVGLHGVGVDVVLGTTNAESYEQVFERYALISSQPEGQALVISAAVGEMAAETALRAAALGLLPLLAWWLLLGHRLHVGVHVDGSAIPRRRLLAAGLGLALLAVAAWQPWDVGDGPGQEWTPLAEQVPDAALPPELVGVQIEAGLLTSGTEQLVRSAIDTYDRAHSFYRDVLDEIEAADLAARLRQPGEGETVVALISDRHDNVGMDRVARAIADAGGATAVFDAGDDTSTGSTWEAFSLDSVTEAFEDLDRWSVAGNHDQGGFVADSMARRGWTVLDGRLVEGPGGIRLLGASDPRSSGLGTWRSEPGESFEEHQAVLRDLACEADADGERAATVLVHDVNQARLALEAGCVDLVLGGHVHERVGPERVEAAGAVGYRYTTGTTGGAAYAFAMGSKLRRNAMVSLVTYRDGRALGVQSVTVRTVGDVEVSTFTELTW